MRVSRTFVSLAQMGHLQQEEEPSPFMIAIVSQSRQDIVNFSTCMCIHTVYELL